MNGFDYLNELLRKKHDGRALGAAIKLAGLTAVDLEKWTEEEAMTVVNYYLVTAKFPPTSFRAVGVQDEHPAFC